jgi:hypothetical protein
LIPGIVVSHRCVHACSQRLLKSSTPLRGVA